MKKYAIERFLTKELVIVKGPYKDLIPGDIIAVFKDDRSWTAEVETRLNRGAAVRLITEN